LLVSIITRLSYFSGAESGIVSRSPPLPNGLSLKGGSSVAIKYIIIALHILTSIFRIVAASG